LATQRLRQIKREIRVLGVAAGHGRNGFMIVGAVYRGNLWLDGILKAHSESGDITPAIVNMLTNSPHSGQVRVIILSHDNLPAGATISPAALYAGTGKPVIILGDPERFKWKKGGEETSFSAEGLGRWSAEGALNASTRGGTTPEALRVAALTLSALLDGLDA
jgi:endonuclease V-like protein UPF0215 family